MVIGAYRPGNSAVSNFVEVLKSEGVDHTVMALAPLNATTIAELMQSCLRYVTPSCGYSPLRKHLF